MSLCYLPIPAELLERLGVAELAETGTLLDVSNGRSTQTVCVVLYDRKRRIALVEDGYDDRPKKYRSAAPSQRCGVAEQQHSKPAEEQSK